MKRKEIMRKIGRYEIIEIVAHMSESPDNLSAVSKFTERIMMMKESAERERQQISGISSRRRYMVGDRR